VIAWFAWLWPAGLVVVTLAGTTEVGAADRGATTKRAGPPEAVDAEMLRDLDLLSSPDYARDREVARRMGLLERMRMLETQRAQEAPGAPTAPASPEPPPPPVRDGR
jgi:hypothetical protein